MKITRVKVAAEDRANALKQWLEKNDRRLGLITSIDGGQLITLVLDPANGAAECWETPVESDRYHSLTSVIPQCHWYERTMWDMFGLYPEGHPRLKHNLLHEPYDANLLPLRDGHNVIQDAYHRNFVFLEVKGEGIYELPVGPIHAGIIEPGHFRFSCLGEIVINLEIHLGYVHRGVEKRMTEIPWRKTRFVAEAAASDSAAAYALANAKAIESLLDVEIPKRAEILRAISLEIERIAMHIADLGGLAGDIGFLAISSSMARLRGNALRLGELLTGTRFQRAFICPGGITCDPKDNLKAIQSGAAELKSDLHPILDLFLSNQVARDRMEKIGRVAPHLAKDFGLVGVGARASNSNYDSRKHFGGDLYSALPIACESDGDVFCRAKVRISELQNSLDLIDALVLSLFAGPILSPLPEKLPKDGISLGIVEAHRGELIHMLLTNGKGEICRYAIKDPSVNNWTGLAIAVRNNLVADFPLCNKSFALSYSGHDL